MSGAPMGGLPMGNWVIPSNSSTAETGIPDRHGGDAAHPLSFSASQAAVGECAIGRPAGINDDRHRTGLCDLGDFPAAQGPWM